ncbi:HlyIII-domain-containing protein [Amylocystis lapponica]|nr:HlyIII-domain-containing protein [Amylocystis lapponica]
MATTTATETVQLHRRHALPKRRFSTVQTGTYAGPVFCQPLPHSIEALDLSYASITPTLATLRLHVLSYLADLEARLALLDSPISSDALKLKGELTVEEARAWARDGLELLQSIRTDVCSHLPEFSLERVPTVESLKSHMPDVPGLGDVRAHLPDMPDVRSRLPDFDLSDMRSRLDDVRSRIAAIDFHRPLKYIPTLSQHLQTLQTHLSSMELPYNITFSSLAPSATLSDLLDKVISSELISEISSDIREGEDMLEKAAVEIARAMKQSLNGSRLIHYVDLPEKWRNNPFVKRGYRFIPLHDWPRLLLSLFALHNETLNIHTHFIPFVAFLLTLFPLTPFMPPSAPLEAPVFAFTSFALICLFTSSLWHTMSGCAHEQGMELCARIDYVGIGWLISASVGTIVYYGFQCHPTACKAFLSICLVMGLSGSILPFTGWFNKVEYRLYRITFFVALALVSIAPLAYLSQLFSFGKMIAFIRPVAPSFASYIIGLVFYATHFPECFLASRWSHSHLLDYFGGGSHAIWHVFIVIAISQHKNGMAELRDGIGEICR